MKKILPVFLIFLACSKPLDKPKNLIPKDKMSEIVAELTLRDQMNIFGGNADLTSETKQILKQQNVRGEDVVESYKYYYATPGTLTSIFDNAQKIILSKDPEAKNYIEKKRQPGKLQETK